GTRQTLGVVEQFVEVQLQCVEAVAIEQPGELALGDQAGGDLGRQVVLDHVRHAHVFGNDALERLVRSARVVQLEQRDAQAFSENLRRVGGVAAGHPAADVRLVPDRGRKAGQLATVAGVKQRL